MVHLQAACPLLTCTCHRGHRSVPAHARIHKIVHQQEARRSPAHARSGQNCACLARRHALPRMENETRDGDCTDCMVRAIVLRKKHGVSQRLQSRSEMNTTHLLHRTGPHHDYQAQNLECSPATLIEWVPCRCTVQALESEYGSDGTDRRRRDNRTLGMC